VERAALARFAFYPDFSTHHADQAIGNSETQTGAAVFAAHRAVRLREGLKDRGLFLLGDADAGVANGKMQAEMLFGNRINGDVGHDFAALGEFQRVADEIQVIVRLVIRVVMESSTRRIFFGIRVLTE
jgi:hypothetical protein